MGKRSGSALQVSQTSIANPREAGFAAPKIENVAKLQSRHIIGDIALCFEKARATLASGFSKSQPAERYRAVSVTR